MEGDICQGNNEGGIPRSLREANHGRCGGTFPKSLLLDVLVAFTLDAAHCFTISITQKGIFYGYNEIFSSVAIMSPCSIWFTTKLKAATMIGNSIRGYRLKEDLEELFARIFGSLTYFRILTTGSCS